MLPHAYPFLLLDRALMIEPGCWAVALKNVTGNDPLVEAGVLAPVLLAEVMAQAAGLAAGRPSEPPAPAVLAQIDRFRCRSPIVAGDQLVVTARIARRYGTMVKVRASVRVARRWRAGAELLLHFPAATGPSR